MTMSTSDRCIVAGDLRLIDEGKLQFIHLKDEDDKIQEGEKIVTSDVSEKFLPGILIGYVSEIKEDPNNLTKTGTLTPVVDFEHLSEVLVIKELKQQKGCRRGYDSGLLYTSEHCIPIYLYWGYCTESDADSHSFPWIYAGEKARIMDWLFLRDSDGYFLRISSWILRFDISVHWLHRRMLL